MANLKNIVDLPMAESVEGLNLIVNDNGSAKQIAASAVGVKSYNDLEDKPCYTEVDENGNETVHKIDVKYLPNVGGGYDLVIKCQDGEYSLVQGSYADTLAKMQAGIPPVVIYCYDHYIDENRINFYYMPVEGVTKMFDRDDIAVDLGNMQYLCVYEDGRVEFVDES